MIGGGGTRRPTLARKVSDHSGPGGQIDDMGPTVTASSAPRGAGPTASSSVPSLEVFIPNGPRPLLNTRITNPRNTKIEFDRNVRSNVLKMEGDVTASKLIVPKDGDRPLTALQINYPFMGFQIMQGTSGHVGIELAISYATVTRLKLAIGTHYARTECGLCDKNSTLAKVGLTLPRNTWVHLVIHVPALFTVAHNLRSPDYAKFWIDSVSVAGSVKLRRITAHFSEDQALGRPSGLPLCTLPPPSHPCWTSGGDSSAHTPSDEPDPMPSPPSSSSQQQEPSAVRSPLKFSRNASGQVVVSSSAKRVITPSSELAVLSREPVDGRDSVGRDGPGGSISFEDVPPEDIASATPPLLQPQPAGAGPSAAVPDEDTSYVRIVEEDASPPATKAVSRFWGRPPPAKAKPAATPATPPVPDEWDGMENPWPDEEGRGASFDSGDLQTAVHRAASTEHPADSYEPMPPGTVDVKGFVRREAVHSAESDSSAASTPTSSDGV